LTTALGRSVCGNGIRGKEEKDSGERLLIFGVQKVKHTARATSGEKRFIFSWRKKALHSGTPKSLEKKGQPFEVHRDPGGLRRNAREKGPKKAIPYAGGGFYRSSDNARQ